MSAELTAPIRVLVVDDHAIVRKGICALLSEIAGIEVVGEAADGREAIGQAERLKPDVILMDLLMPHVDGIEATRQIVSRRPGSRILVLTSFATDDKVFPAIKAGALGYLLKDSSPDDLVSAIHQIQRGESSLHPIIARKVLAELAVPSTQPPTPDPLSARELTVLRLLAHGLSNPEIAQRLSISEATVRSHVSNILNKLHLASRIAAALYALREGLASLDEG